IDDVDVRSTPDHRHGALCGDLADGGVADRRRLWAERLRQRAMVTEYAARSARAAWLQLGAHPSRTRQHSAFDLGYAARARAQWSRMAGGGNPGRFAGPDSRALGRGHYDRWW